MQRLSGAYFYRLAQVLEPLEKLNEDMTGLDAYPLLITAQSWIDSLMGQPDMVRLKSSTGPCLGLKAALSDALSRISSDYAKPLGFVVSGDIKARLAQFRTTFLAEMNMADFYVILPKGAFDTTTLAEEGRKAFHPDLAIKAPNALWDADQAGRCIAFGLPTAAAFHLHRLNETVMYAYYDKVTGGKPRPQTRNIGAYIDSMRNHQVGSKEVFGILAMIKDHYRNPVLHPEQTLESVDQAIGLLGIIRAASDVMMKELPLPPLVLEPSPNPALIADETKTA